VSLIIFALWRPILCFLLPVRVSAGPPLCCSMSGVRIPFPFFGCHVIGSFPRWSTIRAPSKCGQDVFLNLWTSPSHPLRRGALRPFSGIPFFLFPLLAFPCLQRAPLGPLIPSPRSLAVFRSRLLSREDRFSPSFSGLRSPITLLCLVNPPFD